MFQSSFGSGLFDPFSAGDPFATGVAGGYSGPGILGIREAAVKQMGVDRATAVAKSLAKSSQRPALVPIPNTGASKVVRPMSQTAMSKLGVTPGGKRPMVMAPALRGVDMGEYPSSGVVRNNALTRQIAMQNAWLSTQPTIASRGSGGAGVAGLGKIGKFADWAWYEKLGAGVAGLAAITGVVYVVRRGR